MRIIAKCRYSLFPDFKNEDKNIKTFLKDEKIHLGSKVIISNSNKMQPLLNASKA